MSVLIDQGPLGHLLLRRGEVKACPAFYSGGFNHKSHFAEDMG